jgi:hypothetical protein
MSNYGMVQQIYYSGGEGPCNGFTRIKIITSRAI